MADLSEIYETHQKKGKKSSYCSLFPEDDEFATKCCRIMTAIQAAKISAGSDLEKSIVECSVIPNTDLKSNKLEDILKPIVAGNPVDIMGKSLKVSLKQKNVEVDLFRVCEKDKRFYIAELKDSKGEFDTKKASSEYNTINSAKEHIQAKLPDGWQCVCYILCWNYDGTANFKSEKAKSILLNGSEAEDVFGYEKLVVEQKREEARQRNSKTLKKLWETF